MQRQAWILQIREGQEERYRLAHQHVWEELIEASRDAGFRNHTVFLRERTVIAYLEAENVEEAESRLSRHAVLKRWNEAMSELLEETSTPALEEVFHFD